MSERKTVTIKAADEALKVVWGEVYVPDVPDTDNEAMSREEIRKMAWAFAASGRMAQVDKGHDNQRTGAVIVETFIARDDDPLFIPGSWVVGCQLTDADWDQVLKGEINGFSMQARVYREPGELELWVPDELDGVTEPAADHAHIYALKLDDEGRVAGGRALAFAPDGTGLDHTHEIKRASITEERAGHSHRYAFLDRLIALQPVLEAGMS